MSLLYAMSFTQEQIIDVFTRIPGLMDMLQANTEINEKTAAQYPDAAFVIRLVKEPVHHDWEINQITYRALKSILRGESIPSVQYLYDREMDAYLRKHLWDA